MLLPAPVELPCRPEALRRRALRPGRGARRRQPSASARQGNTADLLHLLCGGEPRAGEVQSCARSRSRADHHPRRRRAHAPAGPLTSRSRSTRAPRGRGPPRHPRLGLRRPGQPPHRPDPARAVRAGQGDLPTRPVASRPAALLRGPARPLRRLGRGHDRRDVPRDPAHHLMAIPSRATHDPQQHRHAEHQEQRHPRHRPVPGSAAVELEKNAISAPSVCCGRARSGCVRSAVVPGHADRRSRVLRVTGVARRRQPDDVRSAVVHVLLVVPPPSMPYCPGSAIVMTRAGCSRSMEGPDHHTERARQAYQLRIANVVTDDERRFHARQSHHCHLAARRRPLFGEVSFGIAPAAECRPFRLPARC